MPAITQTALARVLGITRPRVSQLVKSGQIPREDDGTIDVERAVAAYRENVRGRVAPADDADDGEEESFAAARARRERAEADIREIRAARARGELVEREDMDAAFFAVARRVRDRLLLVPARVTVRVRAAESAEDGGAILTAELELALTELSDAIDLGRSDDDDD